MYHELLKALAILSVILGLGVILLLMITAAFHFGNRSSHIDYNLLDDMIVLILIIWILFSIFYTSISLFKKAFGKKR